MNLRTQSRPCAAKGLPGGSHSSRRHARREPDRLGECLDFAPPCLSPCSSLEALHQYVLSYFLAGPMRFLFRQTTSTGVFGAGFTVGVFGAAYGVFSLLKVCSMILRKFGSPIHVFLSGQAFFRLTEQFVCLILELESDTVTTLCCFHYDPLSLHKLCEAICPNTSRLCAGR